jgi:hypothetical protein
MPGIGGRWAGTYEVRDGLPRLPVAFEADFSSPAEQGGKFTGRLLGPAFPEGQAIVRAAQEDDGTIRFQASLVVPTGHLPSVLAFQGRLTEDGDYLTGTVRVTRWRAGAEKVTVGRWETRRVVNPALPPE